MLGALSRLLDDNERLERELGRVYSDIDVARARIKELEALTESLQQERYGVKQHTKLGVIVALVAAIGGVVGPIAGSITDAVLAEPAQRVVEVSEQVRLDCGDVIIDDGTFESQLPDNRHYPAEHNRPPPETATDEIIRISETGRD